MHSYTFLSLFIHFHLIIFSLEQRFILLLGCCGDVKPLETFMLIVYYPLGYKQGHLYTP